MLTIRPRFFPLLLNLHPMAKGADLPYPPAVKTDARPSWGALRHASSPIGHTSLYNSVATCQKPNPMVSSGLLRTQLPKRGFHALRQEIAPGVLSSHSQSWLSGSFSAPILLSILFLILIAAGFQAANADPLDNWQWRNPLPAGNTLDAVTFGNGTFVALGTAGTFLTSPDGVNWSSGNTADTYTNVTFLNDQFIALGNVGAILTSTDGLNWNPQESYVDRDLYAATYGTGSYVVVGAYGTILTSPDAVVWDGRNSGTGFDLNGVSFGNGNFVAVGGSGTVLTSTDAAIWTSGTSGVSEPLISVAYGANEFLSIGQSGQVYSSSNGLAWTRAGSVGANPGSIVFEKGVFVVVNSAGVVQTSSDGSSWVNVSPGVTAGVAYGNGTFVAVGTETDPASGNSFGGIWTSLNAQSAGSWTQINTAYTYQNLLGMAYGNFVFVLVGQNNTLMTSPDGEIWTPRTSEEHPL